MSAQRRSALADLSPRYAHMSEGWKLHRQIFVVRTEETLQPWLSKMRPMKILIRLCEFAGLSESSLGAHVRRYVF